MIAPAAIGRDTPSPPAMPIRAMPAVEAVTQELPVQSETTQQIRQEAARK